MQTADFTIAEFRNWVCTKPAAEKYDYCRSSVCALAQFAAATGRAHLVGPRGTDFLLDHSDLNFAISEGKQTFGALATRLDALLPAEPLSDTWIRADAYLTDIEDVARERVQA